MAYRGRKRILEGKRHRARLGLIRDEYVVMKIRAHWIALLPGLFAAMVMGLFSLGVLVFSVYLSLAIALAFLALAIWIRALLYWYHSVYHITNRRIFWFRLIPGFRYDIDEVIFDLIKQLEVIRPSFASNIFDYGHIYFSPGMETEGSIFCIRWVANPQKVFRCINEALNQIMISDD